ncbi:MAG: hypothetical protein JEY96_02095 [Bacteroidales bacterium]|nr:hypothetical protein [Bacteroidales bacterium]
MNSENNTNEIDLIEVFINAYKFFHKHFWVLFASLIVGSAVGYSTRYIEKEHYESSMIIESYTLKDEILVEYINNIQRVINDKNYSYLSNKFGLSELEIIDLKEINASKIIDEKSKKELNYIKIIVKTNNNKLYNNLSDNLQSYLNKEVYITEELEIFKEQNLSLIENINSEILFLEELQRKNIKSNTNNKTGVNIYNDQNSFHKDILGLIKEKQKIQKELNFAIPFRVIDDFIIYQTPIKRTVTYTLTSGLLFGFIALFYLLIKQINRRIKNID